MPAMSRTPARISDRALARPPATSSPDLSAPALRAQRAGNAAAGERLSVSGAATGAATGARTSGYRPAAADVLRSLGEEGVDGPGSASTGTATGTSTGTSTGASTGTATGAATGAPAVSAPVDAALSSHLVQSCPGITVAEAGSLLGAPETAVRTITFGTRLSTAAAWLALLQQVEAQIVAAPVAGVPAVDPAVPAVDPAAPPSFLEQSPALAPEGGLIPGVSPEAEAARAANRALAERLTAARLRLADPGALTDAECDALIKLANADSTLAAAQAALSALYGARAGEAADRLHSRVLAGSTAARAEILYSRIRPAAVLPEDVDDAVAAYTLPVTLPLGGRPVTLSVQTPYHISTRRAGANTASGASPAALAAGGIPGSTPDQASAATQTAWAKGSPDETEATLQAAIDADIQGVRARATAAYDAAIAAEASEEEARTAASDAITQWMGEQDVGVDCSGFTINTVRAADEEADAAWAARNPNRSDQVIATNHSSAALQTNTENAVPIPVSAAQSGDLATPGTASHIGIVRDNVHTTFGAVLTAITDEAARAERRRVALAADSGLKDDSVIHVVQIAHSIDANGRGDSSDVPGPHTGTYAYNSSGRRIWVEDVASGAFTSFFRNKVKPTG